MLTLYKTYTNSTSTFNIYDDGMRTDYFKKYGNLMSGIGEVVCGDETFKAFAVRYPKPFEDSIVTRLNKYIRCEQYENNGMMFLAQEIRTPMNIKNLPRGNMEPIIKLLDLHKKLSEDGLQDMFVLSLSNLTDDFELCSVGPEKQLNIGVGQSGKSQVIHSSNKYMRLPSTIYQIFYGGTEERLFIDIAKNTIYLDPNEFGEAKFFLSMIYGVGDDVDVAQTANFLNCCPQYFEKLYPRDDALKTLLASFVPKSRTF